jgi:hypothetical protein
MKSLRHRFKKGLATALLLTSVGTTAVSYGFVGGFGSGLGGSARSLLQLNGSVLCTQCSVDEVRRGQPHERNLYQFSHKNGTLVFKVTSVNEASLFEALAWPPRLWVRASDEVLRKLSAEENLFKPIGITGILGSTRTLDIADVAIRG